MESKETTPKRVQRSYTIDEKLSAIKRVKEHSGNLSVASRELGIDRKRLREWCRQESDLTKQSDKKRRRAIGGGRRPSLRNLETKLFQWIVAQCANNMIINYRRLREHTFVLTKELEIEMPDFKCSDKWIFNFMKRNSLTVGKMTNVGQVDNTTGDDRAQIASDRQELNMK
ncbi:unnamed protein product [Rodentolepis nana]|uniref:HTH CENPB-type domain-containing protein n=1 Tax=Rodentolepis nana TaxID=102285 RepID=A0A0R3TQX4_RODNA|nr:unnamed protein product [Rodentolepis nana]